MNIRFLFALVVILISASNGFSQDSFGPGSRWVYDFDSGFFHGINIIEFQKTETISDLEFNKFDKTQTRAGFNTDTTQTLLAPIYFRNQDQLILVSFDGAMTDTLFNFKADEGDVWVLTHPDTEITIRLEVVDTFRIHKNEVEIVGQLLSYQYSTGRRFVDTVLNYVGNIFGYVDPFEFILGGVENVEGGDLRCFYHPSLGLHEFNGDRVFSYDYECDGIITSTYADHAGSQGRTIISTFTLGGKLHLNCQSCIDREYRIFDVSGRTIKRGSLVEGVNEIDLLSTKRGIYFLKVQGRKPGKFNHYSN
jgi:hypothetical protein